MTDKKDYDLYKCYGLIKLMQEKNRLVESLLNELGKELNCSDDWIPNLDLHYNESDVTIEDVKFQCDEYLNKK